MNLACRCSQQRTSERLGQRLGDARLRCSPEPRMVEARILPMILPLRIDLSAVLLDIVTDGR